MMGEALTDPVRTEFPLNSGSILAALLPAAIDHLTPDGKLPETTSLEGSLTSLLSGLGR
jgi:hypothetical protein